MAKRIMSEAREPGPGHTYGTTSGSIVHIAYLASPQAPGDTVRSLCDRLVRVEPNPSGPVCRICAGRHWSDQ